MATKNQQDNEGIYYRAIIFNNDEFSSLLDIFSDKLEVKQITSPEKNYSLYYFKINYKVNNLPNFLNRIFEKQDIVKDSDGNGNYPIKLFGIDIYEDRRYYLVASPITDQLLSRTLVYDNHYYLANLNKLFNHNLLDIERRNLRISRINASVSDENNQNAQSITLYGDDIIKSNILKYIMEGRFWEKRKAGFSNEAVDMMEIPGGPFQTTDINSKPKIEPNSCKITLIENSNRKYGINIDKFGNFSFFLKDEDTVHSLLKIIKELFQLRIITKTTLFNPLQRSDESLKDMENGKSH